MGLLEQISAIITLFASQRANELTPKLIGSVVGKFPRNTYLLAELYYTLGQRDRAKLFVEVVSESTTPWGRREKARYFVEAVS